MLPHRQPPTTFAMGAGMVPIAIGWGADVEFRSPMAIAVLGGLAVSTLGTIDMFAGIELAGLGIDSGIKYQPVLAGGIGLAFAGTVNLLR